jgi:hypothetical protein
VLEAVPHPRVFFNVACCVTSRAGPTTRSSPYARRSWVGGCREMAKQEPDFDPIREEPAFQEFVGR